MYISLFLLVAASPSLIDGRHFRNDYVFKPFVNGWMKFQPMPATWEEARLRCQLEGSVLASPLNYELYTTMKTIGRSAVSIFTGFAAAYSNGDFISVEGIPFNAISASWAAGEPDNRHGIEQCIAMFSNGSLADVSCNQPQPYICYKKNSQDLPAVDSCGTTDPEYVFEEKTGHCYKFHRFGQTWARASMACTAEGGYLAIINSETEAQALITFVAKHPAQDVKAKHKDIFTIGFHDWSESGVWMTVQGQTLQKAGYERWASGQPDNATTGEYCGAMNRAAELYDIWCDVSFPFICEKSPGSLLDNATGTTDNATGTTDNATGTTDNATGTTDNATGTTDNATGTTDNATGTTDNATGTTDNATGTTDNATGTTDNATGTTDNATGTTDNATGTTDNATGTTDNATGTTDNATGTTDNATGTTDNATGTTDGDIRLVPQQDKPSAPKQT